MQNSFNAFSVPECDKHMLRWLRPAYTHYRESKLAIVAFWLHTYLLACTISIEKHRDSSLCKLKFQMSIFQQLDVIQATKGLELEGCFTRRLIF